MHINGVDIDFAQSNASKLIGAQIDAHILSLPIKSKCTIKLQYNKLTSEFLYIFKILPRNRYRCTWNWFGQKPV